MSFFTLPLKILGVILIFALFIVAAFFLVMTFTSTRRKTDGQKRKPGHETPEAAAAKEHEDEPGGKDGH